MAKKAKRYRVKRGSDGNKKTSKQVPVSFTMCVGLRKKKKGHKQPQKEIDSLKIIKSIKK